MNGNRDPESAPSARCGSSRLEEVFAAFEESLAIQEREPREPAPLAEKVVLGIEESLMAGFIGADLERYYGGTTEEQIVYQLEAQRFRKAQFPQLGYRLSRYVQPDFGTALTATILGVPWNHRQGQQPWARGTPPIKTTADLENRPLPDFFSAGMMPAVLRRHAEMQEILGDSFVVGFPGWFRGPLGNAFYLAGAERTLTSMYTDQRFYHSVMRYGMDAMKKWIRERAEHLNEPVSVGSTMTLFNDEVAAENFPPELYRDLVAPYDLEFFEFFGGDIIFHSCGNTTPLMRVISETAPWFAFHVSPWSDLEEALHVFPQTPLLVCLHPLRDVLGASLKHAESRIRGIASSCQGRQYRLCLTELMPVNSPEQDLAKLKDVLVLCESIL